MSQWASNREEKKTHQHTRNSTNSTAYLCERVKSTWRWKKTTPLIYFKIRKKYNNNNNIRKACSGGALRVRETKNCRIHTHTHTQWKKGWRRKKNDEKKVYVGIHRRRRRCTAHDFNIFYDFIHMERVKEDLHIYANL